MVLIMLCCLVVCSTNWTMKELCVLPLNCVNTSTQKARRKAYISIYSSYGHLKYCKRDSKMAVDKGTCHQVWWPEFNPWAPHGGKRTSSYKLSSDHTHSGTHIPHPDHKINKRSKHLNLSIEQVIRLKEWLKSLSRLYTIFCLSKFNF